MDNVLELARCLAQRANLPPPQSLTRLTGGKNNRVFRAGESAILKLYHWDLRDPRDRLRAEWQFLSYAWARGVRNIPRPLAKDDDAHAGLYSWMPGEVVDKVSPDHVEAALGFLLAINAPPHDPAALDPGSEACFSLREHLATINRRVARLAVIDPDVPQRAAAELLIRSRLMPLWELVQATLLKEAERLGVELDAVLEQESQCISPSDFGFHNALVDGSRIGFIDFEYAGRDDVAKLVCDFFCQPQVPVPLAYMEGFASRLITGLGLGRSHEVRCQLLLDAYRIKWACIILNDFLPVGSSRRAHAELIRNEERCVFQLARATAKLNEIAMKGPVRGVS